MIEQILADKGIVPMPCELQYLDSAAINILSSNPSDCLQAWAVRLRSGEIVLLIPDTEDKAWLFVEEEGAMWIFGDGLVRVQISKETIESRIREAKYSRRR